jgi:hypothetical protein
LEKIVKGKRSPHVARYLDKLGIALTINRLSHKHGPAKSVAAIFNVDS